MKISHSVGRLTTSRAWTKLKRLLDSGTDSAVVENILRHVRILNARSYVFEDPYIDRDYSNDYSQFYSRTFRTHERSCKRVHFFLDDISPLLRRPLSSDQLSELGERAEQSYLGFCVVRPLSHAPIGRTVLSAHTRNGFDLEATVTCRAEFKTHLLGIPLSVTGTSFLQQDTRVGACAQVAIWTGTRHMHARHGYNWVSVADITSYSKPPSVTEAASLPNASDGLSSNAMVRAISSAGYQPLVLPELDIAQAILPYVESGIPVILGLNLGSSLGHAVTVVGRVFAKQRDPTNRAIDYVPAFVVHDDQSGPYMWLPTDEHASTTYSFIDDTIKYHGSTGSNELNVGCNGVLAIALMPTQVFSTAARAEHNARSRIKETLEGLSKVRRALVKSDLSVHELHMNELETAYKEDAIVLRTYLTSAAGYRRHLAQGSASDDLKEALLDLHLPHFTWVTEISTIDSYNQSSPGLRRIYGHTVTDATSSAERTDSLLVFHLPGLLITNDPNATPSQNVSTIKEDKLYECREKRL